MLLAIDTSTQVAGVALWQAETVFAELTWHAGQNHTAELIPNIQLLLDIGRISLEALTGLAVAKGPGSFNGVRVGISAAKGLALARELPLVGISTLEVQAYPYAPCRYPVVPVLPAGRGEYAVAKYQTWRGAWRCVVKEQIVDFAGLCDLIGRRALVTGEIAPELADRLRKAVAAKALIARPSAALRRPGALAELAAQRLRRGEVDDVSSLQPIYLRRPPITRRKAS